jgi:hypothetical protein
MSNDPLVIIEMRNGEVEAHHCYNGARCVVVDHSAPHDWAYQVEQEGDETLRQRVAQATVGHKNDKRHAAIAAKVQAHIEGRPALTVVRDD